MKKLKTALVLSLSLLLLLCGCASPQDRLLKHSEKSDRGVFVNGAGAYFVNGDGLALKNFESDDSGLLEFTFSYVGGSIDELFIAANEVGVKLCSLELRPHEGAVPAVTLGLASNDNFDKGGWTVSNPDELTKQRTLDCTKGSGKQLFLVKDAVPVAPASGNELAMYISEITVSLLYEWNEEELDQIFYMGING